MCQLIEGQFGAFLCGELIKGLVLSSDSIKNGHVEIDTLDLFIEEVFALFFFFLKGH